ncbi:hypothetical protein Pcinc_029735 [Petrolisthes cinctipes]|uniref:Uncharacterized protein n=1 Tax=Petrolisthes cinctipes TaxID=88211 RepID=A0AAE1F090_PETCI|nr:hypothetical protein Pcinc_029735 [Petrolisthes cinctipes]
MLAFPLDTSTTLPPPLFRHTLLHLHFDIPSSISTTSTTLPPPPLRHTLLHAPPLLTTSTITSTYPPPSTTSTTRTFPRIYHNFEALSSTFTTPSPESPTTT